MSLETLRKRFFSTNSVEDTIAEAVAAAKAVPAPSDDEATPTREGPATPAPTVPPSEDVRAKEVEDLRALVTELQEELERVYAIPTMVFNDPEMQTWFMEFIKSRYFLENCLTGDGKPVPVKALDELAKELNAYRNHTCGSGTLPATPPTAPTVPGPPAPSDEDDNDDSRPKMRTRLANTCRRAIHSPQSASSGG